MDPARLRNLVLGYWPARAVSAAAEVGVLDLLASAGPLGAEAVAAKLGLRPGPTADLLGALAALGVVEEADGRYRAEPLDAGLLAAADGASYRRWADLPEALRTGRPGALFEAMGDEERRAFCEAFAAVSAPGLDAVAARLAAGTVVLDVGGADGRLADRTDARVVVFDVPGMVTLARERGVEAVAGDLRTDALPPADAVVLSLVLLDWDDAGKRQILERAAAALAPAGRLFVVDRMGAMPGADGTFARLRNLHLLVTLGDAFGYDVGALRGWLGEAGFDVAEVAEVGGGLTLVEAVRR